MMTLKAIILVGMNFLREELALAIAFVLRFRSETRWSALSVYSLAVKARLSCMNELSFRAIPSRMQFATVLLSKVCSLSEVARASLPPFYSSVVSLFWSLPLFRRLVRCKAVLLYMSSSSCEIFWKSRWSWLISSRACCLCSSAGLLSRLAISQSSLVRSFFYSVIQELRSIRAPLMPPLDTF